MNNRLVNCQKILLIKRKIFNSLGNLTLIHLLNAKWKEMEFNLAKAPLLHKLCSSQKSCRVFDTKKKQIFTHIDIFGHFVFLCKITEAPDIQVVLSSCCHWYYQRKSQPSGLKEQQMVLIFAHFLSFSTETL